MAWATTRKMVEELLTAAQHNVNVIFVVLNDGGYGAMKAFGELLDVKDARGLDLPDLNFEQVATGFGLHATRVSTHTELVDALNTVRPDGPRSAERPHRAGRRRAVLTADGVRPFSRGSFVRR